MNKKDIRSIAYLYDEMDPSEKLEFERDLQKDNNLLIEVETLRNVSEKLGKIKAVDPPKELIDSIYVLADKRNGSEKQSYWRTTLYATAALVLIGMTSGILLLDSVENQSPGDSNEASINSPILFENPTSTSSNINNNNKVSPWVDNNEVIHFNDRQQAAENAVSDSIFRSSFQKLTPVTDPAETRSYPRNLHLTGNR